VGHMPGEQGNLRFSPEMIVQKRSRKGFSATLMLVTGLYSRRKNNRKSLREFRPNEGILPTDIAADEAAVGFLGERAQFAWWPTAFYEPSSRNLFLEPVFSKTSRLAQYHGVLEAARRLHDEHLSVGSYHLFRLPEEVEQDLHAIVQSSAGRRTRQPGASKQGGCAWML
jgi:hypothetical protein